METPQYQLALTAYLRGIPLVKSSMGLRSSIRHIVLSRAVAREQMAKQLERHLAVLQAILPAVTNPSKFQELVLKIYEVIANIGELERHDLPSLRKRAYENDAEESTKLLTASAKLLNSLQPIVEKAIRNKEDFQT